MFNFIVLKKHTIRFEFKNHLISEHQKQECISVAHQIKLKMLQSLGGLYDGLAFYALHWSYAPSL